VARAAPFGEASGARIDTDERSIIVAVPDTDTIAEPVPKSKPKPVTNGHTNSDSDREPDSAQLFPDSDVRNLTASSMWSNTHDDAR
jgi:hypothetical protein